MKVGARSTVRRLPVAVLAVLGLQPVGTPPAGAAEQGWQAPLDLSSGYLYTNPTLAPDAGGGFVYVWDERRPDDSLLELKAARVPHSGSAVATESVDGLTFFGARLAADGNGTAVAVWDDRSDLCCVGLSAAIKLPGQGFGDPVPIPAGGDFVTWTEVAINDLGEVVIVYGLHHNDNSEELWAVFGSTTGVFGPPQQVSESADENFQDFHVALADNGEAVVAWASPETDVIRAAIGTVAGFQPPVTLSDPTRDAYQSALATDALGGAVVAWDYPKPNYAPGGPALISVRTPAGEFGAETALPLPARDGPYIDVGASDDGEALVTYADDAHRIVATPVNMATAGVGVTQVIGPGSSGRLAVAPSGEAVVVLDGWISSWGDASGSFGPLRTVSCPSHSLLDVAIGPGSDAAITLLDYAANTGDDTDDRVLIVRSDAAIAPTSESCPGGTIGPPGPPFEDPRSRARLAFEMPESIHVDKHRRLPIRLASNAAGLLTVSGKARVATKSDELRTVTVELGGPGSTTVRPKLPRRIMRALRRRDPQKGEAFIEASLDVPAGRDSSIRRTKVTFRP